MKNLLRMLALSLVLVALIPANNAQAPILTIARPPSWVQLRPEQQKILAPLSKDWDRLSDLQRKRILATAARYPKMKPVEQQRYTKRLLAWSKLPLGKRNIARARYKKFQSLPPEKQKLIKEYWAEQHPKKPSSSDKSTPATMSVSMTEPVSAIER